MKIQPHLRALGVYGFDAVEPVILAALVTEDPLLLIGPGGTGKTFLLNSLSEALGLEHRHYNASLISFDDLVGFPYPATDGSSIRYLETPATVWTAESILVDELSRCRPEHQNRFFSLIHERRLQGIRLDRLRHRWAAMNPPASEQGGDGSYSGCEPLDSALADRFAFIVTVADWAQLSDDDQRLIADPRGEGAVSNDDGELKRFVSDARGRFEQALRCPCPQVIDYCRVVATTLGEVGIRMSPRRARQLARNILAIGCTGALYRERQFHLALRWSLPQRATGQSPPDEVVHAAHRAAWESVCATGPEKWLYTFHNTQDLAAKVQLLLDTCPDADTGSIAVTQLLANEAPGRAAAFAFALYPLVLAEPTIKVGAEGINELGRLANRILHVDGSRRWFDKNKPLVARRLGMILHTSEHPVYTEYAAVFGSLSGARRGRAQQLFSSLFLQNIRVSDPAALEIEMNDCVDIVRNRGNQGRRRSKTRS